MTNQNTNDLKIKYQELCQLNVKKFADKFPHDTLKIYIALLDLMKKTYGNSINLELAIEIAKSTANQYY